MTVLPLPDETVELDTVLQAVPNSPAVFLLRPLEGQPYLARTNVLRRRLLRLLGGAKAKPSALLNLRGTIAEVEYRLTGSNLESQFVLTAAARENLGPDYRKQIRLRMPPYVKLILTNEFPRTQVTARMGYARATYFGPFRSRSSAARFESEFLDLFQLRRCQDDLLPSPEHPGCIYGEMGRCCKPCQQAVNVSEYRSEAQRVAEFLRTSGQSLLAGAAAARERFSAELDFEGAALMHQRHQKIEEILAIRDEMVRDVSAMFGAAVVPSAKPGSIEIGWIRDGFWQGFQRLEIDIADGRVTSLDARLREMATLTPHIEVAAAERAEQLAILARWFYSTWCDGELLLFDSWEKLPYRKLVNAVSRVAQRKPRPSIHSS